MDIKILAQEIKQHLNEHLDGNVSDVVFFGSQIKGKSKPDSDYDVLTVLKTDYYRKTKRLITAILKLAQ